MALSLNEAKTHKLQCFLKICNVFFLKMCWLGTFETYFLKIHPLIRFMRTEYNIWWVGSLNLTGRMTIKKFRTNLKLGMIFLKIVVFKNCNFDKADVWCCHILSTNACGWFLYYVAVGISQYQTEYCVLLWNVFPNLHSCLKRWRKANSAIYISYS